VTAERAITRWRAGWFGVVAAVSIAVPASPQPASLDEILARAGAYVTEYHRELSGVVAEEHYIQDVRAWASSFTTRGAAGRQHRELKSDLLLVRPVGADRWVQFRDVFEVNGRPLRDRSERLLKLFLAPTAATASQLTQIVDESARFNIGNAVRTVNVPVFALIVLDPRMQSRFKFNREQYTAPPVRSATAAAGEAWVIAYQEVAPQTIIKTNLGRDMPSHGRFWIEPSTGRVLATELIVVDVDLHGTIVVGYAAQSPLELLVPVEMRERYNVQFPQSLVVGTATYRKFRQFQVTVDEKFAPIK
jgi:hypothetical protein